MDAKEIQAIIRERVGKWEPRLWAWPHDTFMAEPWGYAIHAASVGAWNAENRETPCVEFLLNWATIENIEAALIADAAQAIMQPKFGSREYLAAEVERLRDINKDLLDALRSIADTWGNARGGRDDLTYGQFKAANEAIRKAEGK